MTELTRRLDEAIRSADDARRELDKIEGISRKDIEDVARSYAKEPSSVLAGIIGAVVGGAGGIALGTSLGTLVVAGPAGVLLGAALAVYSHRGLSYRRLETATEKLRIALNELEGRLRALDETAGSDARARVWKTYERLIAEYEEIAVECLRGK